MTYSCVLYGNRMHSIKDVASQSLTFIDQGHRNRMFEVRAGSVVVATLRRVGGIDFRTLVETTDGNWTFSRETHSGREVLIRDTPTGTHLAVYKEGLISNGVLSFADGRSFHWQRRNLLGIGWRLTDQSNVILLQITSVLAWRSEAMITIEPPARMVPELALLAPLSGYLLGFLYGGGFPLPRWLLT